MTVCRSLKERFYILLNDDETRGWTIRSRVWTGYGLSADASSQSSFFLRSKERYCWDKADVKRSEWGRERERKGRMEEITSCKIVATTLRRSRNSRGQVDDFLPSPFIVGNSTWRKIFVWALLIQETKKSPKAEFSDCGWITHLSINGTHDLSNFVEEKEMEVFRFFFSLSFFSYYADLGHII